MMIALGLVVAMLAIAGCGGDDDDDSGGGEALTEVGEGEGELNLVAWAGYVEDGSTDPAVDWVTDFEKETGCQVNVKVGNTSDEMVTLMRTGEYDGVSASGDASGRLIEGGDVDPVNVDLVPNYADIFPALKDQEWNTVDGVNYGIPHGRGSNLLQWNPDAVKPDPTSWDVVFDPAKAAEQAGKVTAYDNAIYIADAALYLRTHNPELGIRTRTSSTRSNSTPQSICSSSRTRTSASTGPTTPSRSRRSPTATPRSARPGRSSPIWPRPRASMSRTPCPLRARRDGQTRGC